LQFSQRRGQTALLALVATIAAAATAPSAANAVTVTVTGDDGNPVALGGAINIRNMSPHVIATAAAGEFYKYTVTGPNGGQVAVPASACYRASDGPEDRLVDYVGNGAYTVNLLEYGATDQFCQNPPIRQTPLPFSITASVSLAAPPGPVLTRKPGSFVTNTAILPIDLNPGALSNDAFVALNGQVGPDGALLGTPTELFPDSTTRTVAVGLDKGPGNYVVVARA
jgi:hypothetical protein